MKYKISTLLSILMIFTSLSFSVKAAETETWWQSVKDFVSDAWTESEPERTELTDKTKEITQETLETVTTKGKEAIEVVKEKSQSAIKTTQTESKKLLDAGKEKSEEAWQKTKEKTETLMDQLVPDDTNETLDKTEKDDVSQSNMI